jgi:hypothetical protein
MAWRKTLIILVIGLGAALQFAACEEGQPGTQYRCTCQVTCDGQTSVWITEVCRKSNDPHAVPDLAKMNCETVYESDCDSVNCACSGCTELQAMQEC